MQLFNKSTTYNCQLPDNQSLSRFLEDWNQKRKLKAVKSLIGDWKEGYYQHDQFSPNHFILRRRSVQWYDTPNIELKYHTGRLDVRVSPIPGVYLVLAFPILILVVSYLIGWSGGGIYLLGFGLLLVWLFIGWSRVVGGFQQITTDLEEKFKEHQVEYRTMHVSQ